MVRSHQFLIFLISFLLLSCQHRVRLKENAKVHNDKPYVILVSLDGYRHDYAKLHKAAFMTKAGKMGVYSKGLKSVFPTKTFPNHVSIITGLKAGKHGILSNRFYDRKRDEFYLIGDKKSMSDGSWYSGEPLWIAAHKQGMMSASYFWVGSDANIQNIYPTYYYDYNQSTPNSERVEQVVEWLKLPIQKRPHFITLYLSDVDSAGHSYGPNSKEVKAAVQKVDGELQKLYNDVKKLNLPVNFVIVSDHGMAEIKENVYLSSIIKMDEKVVTEERGPFCHLYIKDTDKKAEVYKALKKDRRLTVWRPQDIPKKYGYVHSERTADLTIIMKPGHYLRTSDKENLITGGTHGHLTKEDKDMMGIFYAFGPQIKRKKRIKTFDNIHIYPFIMELLGLEVRTPIDGKLGVLKPILR